MTFLAAGRWRTAARWGFPLISFATILVTQIFIPRLLQFRLGEGPYVAYVAVFAVVTYLGLADGGMFISVMRELSEAHGRRDQPAFLAEAARAQRLFLGAGLIGCVIAVATFSSAVAAAKDVWAGAETIWFAGAVGAILAASCLNVAFGSLHAILLFAVGRFLLGQLVGLAALVFPLSSMVGVILGEGSLTDALWGYACALAVISAIRALHTQFILAREGAGHVAGSPMRPLGHVVVGGLAIKAGDLLPNAAFPHLLAAMGPEQVPTAVPARAMMNGTRLLSQQFLNLLHVHITRRLAGDPDQRRRGAEEYHQASALLAGMHLALVGVAAGGAVLIFHLWLPHLASRVRLFLPGLIIEQALLSAALPASVMYTAIGRLSLIGGARVVGVGLGLMVLIVALPTHPEAAYGLGFAASAVPPFALSAYQELRGAAGFVAPTRRTTARYVLAVVGALVATHYATSPGAVAVVCMGGGLALALTSVRWMWRRFAGRPMGGNGV